MNSISFRAGRTVPIAAWAAFLAMAQQPADTRKARDVSIVDLNPAALKTPPSIPRGYAVVIGISNYKNLGPTHNLLYAETDAQKLYAALLSKEAGNMEFENVKRLIGPEATLQNIREALEVWLPERARDTDRVVVYFVGHGMVDQHGKGYIVPYDVDPQNADTAYPMQRLGDVVSNSVKARWKVLLLDACHSGKVSVDTTVERVNESLRDLPQGFLTIVSSRAAQSSFEDPHLAGGNGVFTYFLVKGWEGAADNSPTDGVVTADELIDYVTSEVRKYSEHRQSPLEFGSFPDNMILGFSPTKRADLVAKLPELSSGNLVIDTNLDSVEVFIDEKSYGKVSAGKPSQVPGLPAGLHKVRGVRMGYDPVEVEVNVVPGGNQTVSLRLLYQRKVKPAAKAFYDEGAAIWERSQSSPADLRKAADLLSNALKEQPDYSQAALALCRVLQAQDQTANALASCLRAVKIDPDYVEARAMAGELYMGGGEYPEAVRQLQQAAIQDPRNTFVASILAEALYLAQRPKEAEEQASRAILLDASSGQGFLIRGEARRAQKNFDAAIDDYQRVLKLEDFRSGAMRTFAFFVIGTGMKKHRSGTQVLYRSHKAAAYYGLCAAEIGRENYLRAIQYCQKSLATEHDDPESYVLLGECYTRLFNDDNRGSYLLDAEHNLSAALRINPDMEQAPLLREKLKEIKELKGHVK